MRARTGSIDVTTDGRHRVRLTLPSGERKTLGVYDTEDEADTERAAAVAVLDETFGREGETLLVFGDRWLTERELARVIRDPQSDWSWWNNHIKGDPIAKLPLRSIRRRHVVEWLKRVYAKVARQSALNALTVVRGALRAAVHKEIIRSNPADDVSLPKEKRTEEPWSYASPAEQLALVQGVAGPERCIVGFAIGSGLRAGEVCTLRLADVHLDGATPHVVVRYGTVPNLSTKTGKIREVPLFGLGLEAARAWLKALPTFAKKNPHRLMFPRARGGYRDENHVLRWDVWTVAKEEAGIVRPFRWHDLRHTCASSLISGWWGRSWTLAEVRDLLGHASITTTERYAHLAETALKKAGSETPGIGHQLASASEPSIKESSTVSNGAALGIWTPDLRFTKSLLTSAISRACEANGPIVAVCSAYLQAVARGDDAAADRLALALGSELTRDHQRTTEIATAILDAALAAVPLHQQRNRP